MFHYPTKPLSVFGVMGAGFRLYFSRFSKIFMLAFLISLYVAITFGFQAHIQQVQEAAKSLNPQGLAGIPGSTGLTVLLILLPFLAIWFYAAQYYILGQQDTGRIPGPFSSLRITGLRYPLIFLVMLCVFIINGVGLLLLVVPGIAAFIFLMLAMPLVVIENKKPIEAIKESFYTIRGSWWHSFFTFLLTAVCIYIIMVLISMIFMIIAHFAINTEQAKVCAVTLAQLFVGTFVDPWLVGVIVVLLHNVRLRKQQVAMS